MKEVKLGSCFIGVLRQGVSSGARYNFRTIGECDGITLTVEEATEEELRTIKKAKQILLIIKGEGGK